jgi:hypothetical protein
MKQVFWKMILPGGPSQAHLMASTTGSDDWIVKFIDVYPPNRNNLTTRKECKWLNISKWSGAEVIRGDSGRL